MLCVMRELRWERREETGADLALLHQGSLLWFACVGPPASVHLRYKDQLRQLCSKDTQPLGHWDWSSLPQHSTESSSDSLSQDLAGKAQPFVFRRDKAGCRLRLQASSLLGDRRFPAWIPSFTMGFTLFILFYFILLFYFLIYFY